MQPLTTSGYQDIGFGMWCLPKSSHWGDNSPYEYFVGGLIIEKHNLKADMFISIPIICTTSNSEADIFTEAMETYIEKMKPNDRYLEVWYTYFALVTSGLVQILTRITWL